MIYTYQVKLTLKNILCLIGVHDWVLLICKKAITWHVKNQVNEAHWRCDNCHKTKVEITNKNL